MAEDLEGELQELTSIAQQILEHLTGTAAGEGAEGKGSGKDDEELARKKNAAAIARNTALVNQTSDAFIRAGKELFSIVAAGAKLASTLGQTVTQGIQQEFQNRTAVAKQIFTADKDRILTMEQVTSAQRALTDTFVSVGEGMEVSEEGVIAFGQSLKGGFKSDFKLTGDSMRALITAGVSTEAGFESLRKASGRASLSNEQLSNMVNKNSLSFMLYGPKFAKAATEAEKLGINLASVQGAQESMVTNLDGTLDTLNQVNQLGAQIDFGTLMRLNEFEGPQATLKYLQSTIPPALFQSASTRALLKGFGISTEDLMKRQGSAQDQAQKSIEASMTKLAEPIAAMSNLLSEMYQRGKAYLDTYGPLIKSIAEATAMLIKTAFAIGAFRAVWLVLKSTIMEGAGLRALFSAGGIKNALGMGDKKGAGDVAETVGGKGGKGGGGFLQSLAGGLTALGTVPRAAIGKAAVILGVLTLAVIGLAYALKVAAPGIVAIGEAIKSTLEGIASIVVAIGTAFGTVITSIGAAIANVFKSISEVPPATLVGLAGGMVTLAGALGVVSISGLTAIPALLAVTNRMKALAGVSAEIKILSDSFKELVANIEKLKNVDLSRIGQLNTSLSGLRTAAPTVSSTVGQISTAASSRAIPVTEATARPVPTFATTLPTAMMSAPPSTSATQSADTTNLLRKMDELIRALREANTVINIDNKVQQVPRTVLAGVNVRNDRV